MGAKDKINNHSSQQEQFSDEEQELNIQQQVENKIKALPSLKEKVQAIAINFYTEKKREIDAQLEKQISQVELKYRTQFTPFIQQMNKIISGEYDFVDSDFQGIDEILTGQEIANKDAYTKKEQIPEYWLKVFLNSDVIGEQVRQIDEPILKHLYKIQAEKAQDLTRLSVYFYFTQNQWFSNTKVAKYFDIVDTEIKKSHGDEINWKEGKNITVKIVKKKGKKGAAKKTKQVKQPSFFNLFKEIVVDSDQQEKQAQSQNQQDEVQELELQYEICENIYEDIIPKSLQYYLDIVGCGDCCGDQNCNQSVCVKKGPKADNKVAEDEVEDDQ